MTADRSEEEEGSGKQRGERALWLYLPPSYKERVPGLDGPSCTIDVGQRRDAAVALLLSATNGCHWIMGVVEEGMPREVCVK